MIVFCLSCANVYKCKGKILICPECEFKIEYKDYKRLIDLSSEAMQFGYQYRKKFEKVYRKNKKITIRYALTPLHEFVGFVALAALSGVTWDLLKIIVKKIEDKILSIEIIPEDVKEVIEDDERLREFKKYVEDYVDGWPELHPTIKEAIQDEMRAHGVTNHMKKLYPAVDDFAKIPREEHVKETLKALMEARKFVESSKKPDFGKYADGLWKDFEDSEQ